MIPKLSVLMPTYNRIHWLGGAIDSVLEPGLDVELIVLDNGSADGTWALLQERAARDARIRPVRWEVNAIGEVYPALLEMATGTYVNFFADDDEMIAGGLARKMKVLDDNPEVGMVFSAVRSMDSTGADQGEAGWTVIAREDFLDHGDLFQSLILGNFVPMPAAMFRRALSPTGAILRDPVFLASHDWQFWLDLSRRTRLAYLREPTLRLRLHSGQVTVTSGIEQGYFFEANLNIWRYWMLAADPPFVPSADAWRGMTRTMYGSLQATHGQDMSRIQEGLRRLYALRDEQDALLARGREDQEAAIPEAFLLEADRAPGAWLEILGAFASAFRAGDPVFLALLVPKGAGPEAAAQVVKALAGREGPPGVGVLEPDQVLAALRAFPHLQWVLPGTALEGAKGRRFTEALGLRSGTVQS